MSRPLQLVRDEPHAETVRQSEISKLFERARAGNLPRSRPLLPHEPATLNERHCQAIMMRVMGMRQCDIAQALGYSDSTVSIVLNHPDAAFIIDALQGYSGTAVTDIDARLKRLTPRAVQAIEEVFDDEIKDDSKAVQARVARARMGFQLLEHTGQKKPQEHAHTHSIGAVTPAAASLIARAIQESRQIEEAEYIIVPTPASGQSEGRGTSPSLPPDTGTPPPSGEQG